MKKVTIEAAGGNTAPRVLRPLSESLGTDGFAINYFERAPGEHVGHCYHRTSNRRKCSTFSRERRRSKPRTVTSRSIRGN